MTTGQITIFYTTDFIQLVYVHSHLNQSINQRLSKWSR